MVTAPYKIEAKKQVLSVFFSFAIVFFCTLMADTVFAYQSNNSFAPGEVMVKFKPETEANRLLSRALRSTPPNPEILAPIARLLSEKIGMPLQLKQLLSGNWVLWVVDTDKLVNQSVAKLREKDSITDIRLSTCEPKPMTPAMKEIEITFRSGSWEKKALDAKLTEHDGVDFEKLMGELSNALSLPLTGKTNKQSHLILNVDLKELTHTLANRLEGLVEIIDSVQLNYISTIM